MSTQHILRCIVVRAGLAAFLLALVGLSSSSAVAQNLVTNPSFETNSCVPYTLGLVGNVVTGWNIPTGDGIYPWCVSNSAGYGPAQSGTQYMVLGELGSGVNYSIQQTLTGLTPGTTYNLSFYIASEQGCCSIARVSFPAGSATASQDFTAPSASNLWVPWAQKSMTFVASASSVTIRFTNMVTLQGGNGYDLGLDNVVVTAGSGPIGTPTLSQWGMIGLTALLVLFGASKLRTV